MEITWLELLGIIAAILDLSMSLPQTYKIWKNKNTDGVSLFTWLTLYTTFVAWTIYTYQQHIIATLGFVIAAFFIGALLLPTIYKNRNTSKIKTYTIILGIPLLLIPFIYFAPAILITIFLLILTFNRIPQIIKSYKTYKSGEYSNVSIAAWILGLSANLCWLTYGILKPDINIILIPLMPILYDITILFFELIGNRKYKNRKKFVP